MWTEPVSPESRPCTGQDRVLWFYLAPQCESLGWADLTRSVGSTVWSAQNIWLWGKDLPSRSFKCPPGQCLLRAKLQSSFLSLPSLHTYCFLSCIFVFFSPLSFCSRITSNLFLSSWDNPAFCISLLTRLSSVQLLSHVRLFATPWTTAHQASLSITNSRSLLRLMSIESVMPSNHLILCHPLFLPPSISPGIRVFSSESVLCIRWPKYWSFSFNISPSNEYSGLISFMMDWLDLLAV